MLTLPASVLGGTILLFVGMVLLVGSERAAGERKVLPQFRSWLDGVCDSIRQLVVRVLHGVYMSGVYLVHQFRHAVAAAIAPRPRTHKQNKRLEFEKTNNHLSSMHDHKTDTALSEAQKKKLRNQKLEERL